MEDHERLLRGEDGDFRALAARRFADLRPGRLSVRRVGSLSRDSPELERMRDIAGGMHVPLPEGFSPNGASAETRPPLRALYKLGGSQREHGIRDRAAVKKVAEALLGEGAIAEDKTEWSGPSNHVVDAIGYALDMSTQMVSISRRNMLRALYLFFSIDPDRPVAVRSMEKVASLASRYGHLCGALRPFTKALYGAYANRPRHVAVELRVEAKRAVRLWRAMLCALRLRED